MFQSRSRQSFFSKVSIQTKYPYRHSYYAASVRRYLHIYTYYNFNGIFLSCCLFIADLWNQFDILFLVLLALFDNYGKSLRCWVGCLHLFNDELSPKRYWRGPRSQEVGEEGDCTYRYTVTTRMAPALRSMVSDVSHCNVSLLVRDKVTRHCPQTTSSEKRGKPKRNRTEALLHTSL